MGVFYCCVCVRVYLCFITQEVSRHVPLIVSSVLSVAESNLLVHAAPLLHSLCTSCVVSPLNGSLAQADPIPAEGELQELAAVQSRAKQHEPGRLLQDVSGGQWRI